MAARRDNPPSSMPAGSDGQTRADDGAFPGIQDSPPPVPSLPKGGGAIRGMGEKFDVNPTKGTASLSIPIFTSPGRDGFGPKLALTYDSASGNGSFGMGWSLSLDAITRKTSLGMPRYDDHGESDVFVLSGAEDLVPVLPANGSRLEDRSIAPGFTVHQYRPRIGALTSRIERWTNVSNSADVHWRVYSGDNTLKVYGRSGSSRIMNPERPEHIFSWLLSDCRDWKGNAIVYDYKAEDGQNTDMTQRHEQSRGGAADRQRTANRYVKSIRYGNRVSFLNRRGQRTVFPTQAFIDAAGWMFELVFDYGEHHTSSPTPAEDLRWTLRRDAFSSYRSGFEIRTARLCNRVLMFHHFPEVSDVGRAYLVNATEFSYHLPAADDSASAYTYLESVQQSGFRKDPRQPTGYVMRSMPPLEMKYSSPVLDDTLRPLDPELLLNMRLEHPSSKLRWIDLYGEGVAGLLEQVDGAWYYKRNISPSEGQGSTTVAEPVPVFDTLETVRSCANIEKGSEIMFADVRGDGQLSVISREGHFPPTQDQGIPSWSTFVSFQTTLPTSLQDPSLKMVDLTGDGMMDGLMTREATWYQSLGAAGFGPPEDLGTPAIGSVNPACMFKNDILGHVFFGDFSGDGLTDIAYIDNGEAWFLPNLGYGRFGSRIEMDNAPVFDEAQKFDPKRIVLADVDGSGTSDMIYLHEEGPQLYLNLSGNGWSGARDLESAKGLSAGLEFATVDLFGNGTTCLVISDAQHGSSFGMKYINLGGAVKPHLLLELENNLGMSTVVQYSTSTRFYQADRASGTPWVSKLAFPVHVVERRMVYDRISRNVFTSRFAYHHGYFDGAEREFRGFGMVEQWDTDELSANLLPGTVSSNTSALHALPPTRTKSWFHLGVSSGAETISRLYEAEYFHDPIGWTLSDTVLPPGISVAEEHHAFRALKGRLLRQETYVDDALPGSSAAEKAQSLLPLSVTEANFTLTKAQPSNATAPAVFVVSPRESISYSYERNPQDPRINQRIVLESNKYGQTLREVSVGYGRRHPDPSLPTQWDREMQTKTYLLYSDNLVTAAIEDPSTHPHTFRIPSSYQQRQYEVTDIPPTTAPGPFTFEQLSRDGFSDLESALEVGYETEASSPVPRKRLLSIMRTLFRRDDLNGLLALGERDSCAIVGQSYALAFTRAMIDSAYVKDNAPLLPESDALLTGTTGPGAGYVSSSKLQTEGLFPDEDLYDGYWAASGQSFYVAPGSPNELAEARAHFFKHRVFKTISGAETFVTFDPMDLLPIQARDSVGNVITVGERDAAGRILSNGNDYRALQPRVLTDCNDNRNAVMYDALRTVAGTAAMGKLGQSIGDTLDEFEVDLDDAVVQSHLQDPFSDPQSIIKSAGSRIVYDIFAYARTKGTAEPQPPAVYSIMRTRHHNDPDAASTEFHHAISYNDGLGRMIQGKTQTKAGPVSQRDDHGRILIGLDGQPKLTSAIENTRWLCTGWTVFDNKGHAVAQYEPFFSHLSGFEFGSEVGVSSTTFLDAAGRTIGVLNPNGTYSKSVFSAWTNEDWDCNDTVALDPTIDPDVRRYMRPFLDDHDPPFRTWQQQRMAMPLQDPDRQAAEKALAHTGTPVIAHLDSLGRPFLKVGQNKVASPGHALDGQNWKQYTRIEIDIQGLGRAVRDANTEGNDARGRVVETYKYDMLGRAMVHKSMDTGTKILLLSATSKELCVWDDRGHVVTTLYDRAGRPVLSAVVGDRNAPNGPTSEVVFNFNIYGEVHPRAKELNLRGSVYLSADQAGVTMNEAKDFKGNLVRSSRRFAREYRATVDWKGMLEVVPPDVDGDAAFDEIRLRRALDATLHSEVFRDNATFDALNRPLTAASLNSDGRPTTTRYTYAAGQLDKVEANIRSDKSLSTAEPLWTDFISSVDFDARGLRTRLQCGNGVTTEYEYSVMRELTRISSSRRSSTGNLQLLQDLRYVYDAMHHQTRISDDAVQTLFFNGQVVKPVNDYTYDALYQLVRATGREHLGQDGGSPLQAANRDGFGSGPLPGDANAMATYTEEFVYDWAGNLKTLKHAVGDPRALGHTWTRQFTHEESSRLESDKHGNRLSATLTGGQTERFLYDQHGNAMQMPNVGGRTDSSSMTWDFLDRLRSIDLGGGGKVFYVYYKGGTRARKVVERSPGLIQERLYLNAMTEMYREHRSGVVTLERESQHVFGEIGRVALLEIRNTENRGSDRSPERVQRWQVSSCLKSATMELDGTGRILSYEEYSPYGSTTYAAGPSTLELPKRFRFAGKERDEETGLVYFGARYYAPWLARWIKCDPGGTSGGPNLYEYCYSNPVMLLDPGGASGQPFQQWLAENAERLPEHVKNILMGRDAELYAYQLEEEALAKGETIMKEVVVGIRDATGKFKVLVRLDIVTNGRVTEVKGLLIRVDEAGNLIRDEALTASIMRDIASAEEKAAALLKYAEGSWVNERLTALGPVSEAKTGLTLVAEGEPHVLMQLQQHANEIKAASQTAVDIKVIKGSGRPLLAAAKALGKAANFARPMAEKAWGATKTIVKVAGKAGAALAIPLAFVAGGLALHTLATSSSTSEKIVAGLELASTVMTFVPGLQIAGAVLGAGIAIGKYVHEKSKEAEAPAPTNDEIPAPAEGEPVASAEPSSHSSGSSDSPAGPASNALSIWGSPGVDKGVQSGPGSVHLGPHEYNNGTVLPGVRISF